MVHKRTPRIFAGFPRRSTVIRSYKYEYTTRASARASSGFRLSFLIWAEIEVNASNWGKTRLGTGPLGIYFWRMQQSLHNDAILFRFFLQRFPLFGSCLRGIDVESDANFLKAHGHFLGKAQRAAQVHVAAYANLYVLGGNSHRGRDELTSDLCARC